MRLTALIVGSVLAAGFYAAPALAQSRQDYQLLLDQRELHEENRQLLVSVNALAEQLKTINAKVDAESNARSKGFADQQTLVNNANSALSALQENVRDNKVQVQKLTQEIEAIRKGVDILTVMVTQALAQMPATPPAADPNAPPPAPAASPTAAGVPPSCNEYYDRAFGDYAVGQYDMASQGFQEFLKRCPTDPHAARVQFYIGESAYMQDKYQDALAAYDQVIQKFKGADPDDSVPDAIYKQGVAYEKLKQRDQAIAKYQVLRKDYPASNAALSATQDLKRLGVIK